MARKLPKKDVVIIGLGWTGSIIANELTDEGLDVVAIERGPWRDAPTEYPPNYVQDELRYRIRHELFLRPEQTTFTFRNKMDQTALPIRSWGAFMPPNGVGGGGVHWNAETWRFLPYRFRGEDAFDPALRRGIPAGRHDHPGLGRHLRRAGAALRRVRISLRHVGDGRQPARPDPGGRQSVRRAALAALSQSRAGATVQLRRCSRRRRASSATSRFHSRRETCRRPTPIRSAFAWGRAPIVASASGSDAATIPRPVRRRRSSLS